MASWSAWQLWIIGPASVLHYIQFTSKIPYAVTEQFYFKPISIASSPSSFLSMVHCLPNGNFSVFQKRNEKRIVFLDAGILDKESCLLISFILNGALSIILYFLCVVYKVNCLIFFKNPSLFHIYHPELERIPAPHVSLSVFSLRCLFKHPPPQTLNDPLLPPSTDTRNNLE